MRKYLECFLVVGLVAILSVIAENLSDVWSQETERAKSKSDEVESRHVDIWSDGTRLSGDLFYLNDLKPENKLPAIILCHG